MLRAYTNNKKLKFCANESYPLITWAEQGEVFSTAITEAESSTQVQIRRFNEINIADELKSKLKDGGCAGIIVNTVKRAQAISEDLRRRFPDKKIYVHHAQFLAEDRIRREKELIRMIGKRSVPETRNNVIVVGTQVLEQSLDIDFDYLITDLCPMDLLLQRIGRLHRHERTRPAALENAACSVMCADGEFESGGKAIYGKWLLKQTNRFLPDNITLPSDIPRLVNQVYAEPVEEIDDPDWEDFRDRNGIKESKAEAWLLQGPRKSRREQGNSIVGMLDKYLNSEKTAEAKVRDGLPSFDVLVMREADDGRIGFLPWISNKSLRADTTPSDEEGRKIAMQRLRLPFAFCIPQQLDETIDELEKENADRLYAWQDSPWLKGELVLVLNRSCEKELCGFKLKYDKNLGLTYERSDD